MPPAPGWPAARVLARRISRPPRARRPRALLPVLTEALDSVEAGIACALFPQPRVTLSVFVQTSFALGWMLPRLPRFPREQPEIELHLSTGIDAPESRDGPDAVVLHGRGPWPDLATHLLFPDRLVPVCASSWLVAHGAPEPRQLAEEALLISDTAPDDGDEWFAHAGLRGLAPRLRCASGPPCCRPRRRPRQRCWSAGRARCCFRHAPRRLRAPPGHHGHGYPRRGSRCLVSLRLPRLQSSHGHVAGQGPGGAADGHRHPLADAMRAEGFDPYSCRRGEAAVTPGNTSAFIELHIEQGPVLEAEDLPIGIVTGIPGSRRHRFGRVLGAWNHSGATPRRHRRDAAAALAELAYRLEQHWIALEEAGS
ncbi:hypothetical protein HMPREF9946_01916 [Acetobacteraceae bacterium AT-5844]|nr:hypothetical protein HMPREF9946_01916 [Acetobacteraceae bacterium AT-5844]